MMRIYGYCRISTKRQSLQRQVDNILQVYPVAEIVKEVYTGTTSDRPAWRRLLDKVKSGDTIVFDSVSRMSRDAAEGVRQYFELYERDVTLIFLKEPYVNTEVYRQSMKQQLDSIHSTGDKAADNLISSIMTAIQEYQRTLAEKQIRLAFEQAEKEVKDLQDRTREGMKASGASEKIRQARTGKKFVSAEHLINSLEVLRDCKEFGGVKKDSEVVAILKTSRMTVFRIKRELQERMTAEQITAPELMRKLESELKEKKNQKKKKATSDNKTDSESSGKKKLKSGKKSSGTVAQTAAEADNQIDDEVNPEQLSFPV